MCPDDGSGQSLIDLLRRAGSGIDRSELDSLVSGIAAAPDGHDPDAWMTLVVPEPDDTVRAALRARLEQERSRPRPPAPETAERLQELRRWMRANQLVGFLVPRADEHQSEQVAAHSERLAWISGFTGSAGTAAVLRERAALFVDGRYTVQAQSQTDPDLWEVRHTIDTPLCDWIAENVPSRGRVGYDPWLHTPSQVARLESACRKAGGRIVPVEENPTNLLWRDRPAAPIAPVVPHHGRFAGFAAAEKRQRAAAELCERDDAAAVLVAPDSIAWLLNIRGGDVPYTPVALAFAILHADATVELFVDPRKLSPGLAAHLGNAVTVAPPEAFGAALDALGARRRRVRIDRDRIPKWIETRLRKAGAVLTAEPDPCALAKSVKNAIELDGMRAAHRRDGAAVTRFLAWLADQAPGGQVTEIAAADRLEALRREGELFRGLSFPTISAAGPHGAIVHYRVTPDTNRRLEPGSLYLVDSGAQYLDGTTDVTRTVAIGDPTDEMRDRFTRVLKGHIAIATARFPKGTNGTQLDTLARQALWNVGLDYDHGTGHGVGSYLNVHEGPQRISKLPNDTALQAGMIISNEPGYYRRDGYGIRIENLVAVEEAPAPDSAEHTLLGLETLTLAPIDRRLIDPRLMTSDEIDWLERYHERVRTMLRPLVGPGVAEWLEWATSPLES